VLFFNEDDKYRACEPALGIKKDAPSNTDISFHKALSVYFVAICINESSIHRVQP
jgi:hypothetical protein